MASKLSLGFFSANSIYRQVRMSADGRSVLCDKDGQNPPYNDPVTSPGNPQRSLTTTLWRWSPVNESEDSLLKAMYGLSGSQGSSGGPTQNMVLINTNFWAFTGTGLTNGAIIAHILGNEVDTISTYSAGGWGYLTISHYWLSHLTASSSGITGPKRLPWMTLSMPREY